MKLILASKSPQKRSLLNKLGLVFGVEDPKVEEMPQKGEKPEAYVRRMAIEKAASVSKKEKAALVIAHDMTIDLDGEIIDKPKDAKEAEKFLKKLNGRSHEVVSGLVLMIGGKEQYQGSQRTSITFKKLSAKEIKDYIATEEWLDKSGAYDIQGDGGLLVESLDGSYFNIVGLPLNPLIKALQKQDIEVEDSVKQTVEMQEESIRESFPR